MTHIEATQQALALLVTYLQRDALGFQTLLNEADHRQTLCALLYVVVHNSDTTQLLDVAQATLAKIATEQ